MMKFTRLLLLGLMSFGLLSSDCFAQSYELADKYWDQAQSLRKQNKHLEAAWMYRKSAEAERASLKPRLKYLALAMTGAGNCYHAITSSSISQMFF